MKTQKIIAKHYEISSRFYVPSKEAYIGARLFVIENGKFISYHNGFHPNLAGYLSNAMCIY
jgi:hypothetical protein